MVHFVFFSSNSARKFAHLRNIGTYFPTFLHLDYRTNFSKEYNLAKSIYGFSLLAVLIVDERMICYDKWNLFYPFIRCPFFFRQYTIPHLHFLILISPSFLILISLNSLYIYIYLIFIKKALKVSIYIIYIHMNIGFINFPSICI